jgi:hypothetical protein
MSALPELWADTSEVRKWVRVSFSQLLQYGQSGDGALPIWCTGRHCGPDGSLLNSSACTQSVMLVTPVEYQRWWDRVIMPDGAPNNSTDGAPNCLDAFSVHLQRLCSRVGP